MLDANLRPFSLLEEERAHREAAERLADQERLLAEEADRQRLAAEARAERLLARLRALGLEEEAG